jgi:hypothetical protein
MSVPIWKRVARNPPPDRPSAIPGRSVSFVIAELRSQARESSRIVHNF